MTKHLTLLGRKQEEKADGIPTCTGQGSNENEDGSTKKDAIKKKSKIQICEDDISWWVLILFLRCVCVCVGVFVSVYMCGCGCVCVCSV